MLITVLAVVAVVAALVAKPWAPPGPGASSGAVGTSAAAAIATTSPAGSARGASPVVPPGAGPIVPLDWTRISLSITPLDMTQMGVVTRSAYGILSTTLVPLEPSDGTDVVTTPLAVVGGRDVPLPNAIRLPAAGAVAVVVVQPGGQGPNTVLVWQVVAPSSLVRVGARHPVGDDARDLWVYPAISAPRGERRDLAQISASPPTWPPGTYRFDLVGPGSVTRYLFVIFEPAGAG